MSVGEHLAIWVVSYPKSGNTWVRTLLRNYIELVYGNEPMETSDVVPYFYHTVCPYPLNEIGMEHFIQLRPAAMMHMLALHQSRQKPAPATLIKSHAVNQSLYGVSIHSPLWMDKTIYVVRDPRDILPSYADHTGKPLKDAVALMAKESAVIGVHPKIPSVVSSWSEHVDSWTDGEGMIEPLVITYEELHENAKNVLKRVIEHCGLRLEEWAVFDAVANSKFYKLQAAEAKSGFGEKSAHQEKFFRRGITGSHKDEVPEELVKQIEKDHAKMMEKFGYV